MDLQSCHRCSDKTKHCNSCYQNDGTLRCFSCNQGFYSIANGYGDISCLPCVINHCIEWIHPNVCTKCDSGYYGSRCQYECSLCSHSTCPSQDCTSGCMVGSYQDLLHYNKGCLACREGCKHCTDFIRCTQCEDGFYNAAGLCIKFQTKCKSCSDALSCVSLYW